MRTLALALLVVGSAWAGEDLSRIYSKSGIYGDGEVHLIMVPTPTQCDKLYVASYPGQHGSASTDTWFHRAPIVQWELRCLHWYDVLNLIRASQRFYAASFYCHGHDKLVESRLNDRCRDNPWKSMDAALLEDIRFLSEKTARVIQKMEWESPYTWKDDPPWNWSLEYLSIDINYAVRHGYLLDFAHFKMSWECKSGCKGCAGLVCSKLAETFDANAEKMEREREERAKR